MKKAFAAIAGMLTIIAAFTACNAQDGRVEDNSIVPNTSSVREAERNRTDRTNNINNSSRITENRSSMISSKNNNNTNDNKGVIHDVGSMTGTVIEDAADGIDNIGSSIASNVSDAMHDDDDYETDNYNP